MSEHGPTPDRIFELVNAYQESGALKGALDLGLFTALGGESRTAAALAADIGATEKGTRILCDFLAIRGLMSKEGDQYRASPDAALFLDRNSPAYFGGVGQFMMSEDVLGSFSDIAEVVRNGGTLMEGQGTVEPENPIWIEFARNMRPLMQPSADFIAGIVTVGGAPETPMKVLDIAAGHGAFGITIAAAHPEAHIVALDWPAVLDVACENAEAAGVADRHSRLEGSAFDVDLGSDYDVVLLTNFLHHFDVETCTGLLRRIHSALKPGGRVVTLEFVPNEDRVSPDYEASFALIMLATTAEGDAYTFSELESMFADAGFSSSELHRQEGPPQSVVVSTR